MVVNWKELKFENEGDVMHYAASHKGKVGQEKKRQLGQCQAFCEI